MSCLPLYLIVRFKLSFLLLLLAANVAAQHVDSIKSSGPNHVLKTTPVQLEEFNLAHEFFRKPNQSVQIGLAYVYKLQTNKGVLLVPRATALSGFSVRLSQRTYRETQLKGLPGFYRGPLATYRYMVFPEGPVYDEKGNPRASQLFQQVFSAQYVWGIQRIFNKLWVLDAFVGVGGRVKYAYRTDPGAPENYKMRTQMFYGYTTAVGPDWAIIMGPSVSLNVAIGVAF